MIPNPITLLYSSYKSEIAVSANFWTGLLVMNISLLVNPTADKGYFPIASEEILAPEQRMILPSRNACILDV